MKILFVTHYNEAYGANKSLLTLVDGLIKKGWECAVLCPSNGGITEILNQRKIPCFVHSYFPWANRKYSIDWCLAPFRRLGLKASLRFFEQELSKFQPDLIYSNSSVIGFGAQLAEEMDLPHFYHVREFAKKHYNMDFYPSRKILLTYFAKAEAIICTSEVIKQEVVGSSFSPSYYIYNGIFTDFPVEIRTKSKDPFTFITVGLLHPQKNQMEALKAFHLLSKKEKNIRLVILGSGRAYYQKLLEWYIKRNGLSEMVSMPGYVSNTKDYYQTANAFLMCSAYEAMGRVTIEAMAHGLPVIGLISGATPELIKDGQTGLLYQNGPKELAEKMNQLLQEEPLRDRLIENGKTHARTNFTIEQYVDTIDGILNRHMT